MLGQLTITNSNLPPTIAKYLRPRRTVLLRVHCGDRLTLEVFPHCAFIKPSPSYKPSTSRFFSVVIQDLLQLLDTSHNINHDAMMITSNKWRRERSK